MLYVENAQLNCITIVLEFEKLLGEPKVAKITLNGNVWSVDLLLNKLVHKMMTWKINQKSQST